jgi:hypothetical protein
VAIDLSWDIAEKSLRKELIDSGACVDGATVVDAPADVVGVLDWLELPQPAAASAAAAATEATDASVRVRDKAPPGMLGHAPKRAMAIGFRRVNAKSAPVNKM